MEIAALRYTKRSREFQEEIDRLIHAVLFDELEKGDNRHRIAEILKENTTDLPDLINADKDEPIFLLRGDDEPSEILMECWAGNAYMKAASRGILSLKSLQTSVDMQRHAAARELAKLMGEWFRNRRDNTESSPLRRLTAGTSKTRRVLEVESGSMSGSSSDEFE